MVRVDGQGTKYAAGEKRAKTNKQINDRMWVLRQENYSDRDIAKKINEEFGVNYQLKSIAAKLPRLAKQKREEEDQKLDEEMSDWHVGEVCSPTSHVQSS